MNPPLKSGDNGNGDWRHINRVAAGADQTGQGNRVSREYLDGRRRLLTPIGGGGGGVNYQTANYTAIALDNGKLLAFKNTSALTLTLPATPPSSTWYISVECIGSGGLTISPNSLNLDTASSNLVIAQNQGLVIYTDGMNYFTERGIGGGSAQMFVITGLSNVDYFTAKTYDGTTLGSTAVKIAKSPRLRPSVASELIDGVTVTYSGYTSDNLRIASDGTNTETQVAFPRYVSNSGSPAVNDMSIVFAVPAATGLTGGSSQISWVEVSPARVWARRYSQ